MIINRDNNFAISFGQETWIFLPHIRAIQLLPAKDKPMLRITWSNGDRDFFEGEDALEIIKCLVAIKEGR